MIIRHGDVLLKKVEGVESKGEVQGEYCLAEGEATGHHHMVRGNVIPFSIGDTPYIKALSTLDLTHEEHSALQIPEGTYEIIIEREFDPFREEMKRVVD